jgi:hypothetical protein
MKVPTLLKRGEGSGKRGGKGAKEGDDDDVDEEEGGDVQGSGKPPKPTSR